MPKDIDDKSAGAFDVLVHLNCPALAFQAAAPK
jgi:hypothetical protein